jgi:hypothetical protein
LFCHDLSQKYKDKHVNVRLILKQKV